MKQRTATKSGSRTRGGMTPRRSRSTLPATRRRPRPAPKSSASKSQSTLRARGASAGKASSSRRGAASGRTSRSAKTTTNHDEIRRWVESRGGHPATVKRTARGRDSAGILRIDFPGFSGEESLKPVSWDQWFKVFDERKLAFLYQGGKGGQNRFNKLVSRQK